MIKIIKPGQNQYTKTCYQCGCEFIYEIEDIRGSVVNCPECQTRLAHTLGSCYSNYTTYLNSQDKLDSSLINTADNDTTNTSINSILNDLLEAASYGNK